MKDLILKVSNYLSEFISSEQDEIHANRILDAMIHIDRSYFAPFDPYIDDALPIGFGQTISQPSTVARMLMLAELEPGNTVLEVGSGSGWNAALIAWLVYPGNVLSTEVVPELTILSKGNLQKLKLSLKGEERLRIHNIEFNCMNILEQLSTWDISYDKIIVTAGVVGKDVQLVKQMGDKLLNEGGLMVCPNELGPLYIVRKVTGKIKISFSDDQYGFVPLIT